MRIPAKTCNYETEGKKGSPEGEKWGITITVKSGRKSRGSKWSFLETVKKLRSSGSYLERLEKVWLRHKRSKETTAKKNEGT